MNLEEIKSVEELMEFAGGTVVLDDEGDVWQKSVKGRWLLVGDGWASSSEALWDTCERFWLLATAEEIEEVIG